MEIDKIYKEKLSNYSSSRKNANWELMQHLLNKQKKKKKIKKLYFFFGISIFLLLLSIGYGLQKSSIISRYFTFEEKITNSNLNANSFNNKTVTSNSAHISFDDIDVSAQQHEKKSEKDFVKNLNEEKQIFSEEHITHETKQKNPNYPKYDFDYLNKMAETYKQRPNNTTDTQTSYAAQNNAYLSTQIIEHKFTIEQKDSQKVEITNLGESINSPFIDFGPVVTADGLTMFFTSNRPTQNNNKGKKENFENVYVSNYDTLTKTWKMASILPEPINVKNKNNSIIGISNDGQTMFLYRDDEKGTGDIYISQLSGLHWSVPEKLPEPINSKYHESTASLSPDGRTIYFISERPGGKGKKDIWYCSKNKNDSWGEAINMRDINTPDDEEGVFIHPDGKTLYFCSKGYNGLGGFDIYKTTYENYKWTKPENLGPPINTSNDDLYFVMEANGKIAYYVSAKNNNDPDIHKIEYKHFTEKKEYTAKLTLFKGKVVDKQSQEPLEAEIEITDLSKNEVISKTRSNSATGYFLISLPFGINYGINIKKEGYLFYSDNVNIPKDETYKEVVKLIELEKIKKGESIVLRNIFFEYNQANLLPESATELNRLTLLLNTYPSMKIEIAGHTDNIGSDEYNLKLSQARAEAVVNYLIGKGINNERLIAKGYGETRPIAPNQNPDNSDNPEGRQLNRRTEFKILELQEMNN